MIVQVIRRWMRLQTGRSSGSLGIVLHTSCLNYGVDQLKGLSELGCRLILPDNVYWELKLLTASKTYFGARAKALLKSDLRICRVSWDLEQLYLTGRDGLSRSELYNGTLLFLFGDLNKQDEFLLNVCELDNSHILIHSDWDLSQKPVICRLNLLRGCTYRQAVPLSRPVEMPELSRLTDIRCVSSVGSDRVRGHEFVWTGKGGSYSWIYTHENYGGKYFKIYLQAAQTGSTGQKLENLERFVRERPITCAGTPEMLLYTGDNTILGYGMPALLGRPLGDYSESRWVGKTPEQIGRILENLMCLLLELHLRGILVNDLSYNNILISRDDMVYIVDFDTVQFREYPGGAITELYRHPEIRRGGELEDLRQPRHEYFSLAVLLFQCLMYDDPLYGNSATWTSCKFSLGEKTEYDGEVNRDVWDSWTERSPVLRRMFTEVFQFRRDHSIGAWYRGLSENG